DDELAFLREVGAERPDLPVIVMGNKRDLLDTTPARNGQHPPHIFVSAKAGVGDEEELRTLVDRLLESAVGNPGSIDASAVVMNERHRSHLRRAREALESARGKLDADE